MFVSVKIIPKKFLICEIELKYKLCSDAGKRIKLTIQIGEND